MICCCLKYEICHELLFLNLVIILEIIVKIHFKKTYLYNGEKKLKPLYLEQKINSNQKWKPKCVLRKRTRWAVFDRIRHLGGKIIEELLT